MDVCSETKAKEKSSWVRFLTPFHRLHPSPTSPLSDDKKLRNSGSESDNRLTHNPFFVINWSVVTSDPEERGVLNEGKGG